uniref:Uncharacterized protein n=1 Tax=Tetraodon nigroviridis TaxID=99883 RepID=H3BWP5_TETNG
MVPLQGLSSQCTKDQDKVAGTFPMLSPKRLLCRRRKNEGINKEGERIEFLHPLQEGQPMNQQNKFSPEINKH